MAVLPGLVNGHTHLSQTFLRGLADDRPLLRWLKEVIWPAQAAMTPEDQYLAGLLGLVENLRCGVTTVVQHHKLPGRDFVDAAASAAQTVGLRMVLARGWVDLGRAASRSTASWPSSPGSTKPGTAKTGIRIRVASGPLAPWRCCDDAMREITALARSWDLPTHIHVAETQDEIDLLLPALRPAAYRVAGGPGLPGPRHAACPCRPCDRRRDRPDRRRRARPSSTARPATCTWPPARRRCGRCSTGGSPWRWAPTAPPRTPPRICWSAPRSARCWPSTSRWTPRRWSRRM